MCKPFETPLPPGTIRKPDLRRFFCPHSKAEIHYSFIWVHKHDTAALDGDTEKQSSLLRVLKISQQHTEQSQWHLDDII